MPGRPRLDTVGTVPTGGEAFTENQEEHWRTPGSRGVCLHPGPRPLMAAEHWGVGRGVMLGKPAYLEGLVRTGDWGDKRSREVGPTASPETGPPLSA